jgi:single-strand DNA-binding protein
MSNKLEYVGKVVNVGDIELVGTDQFHKQTFWVLETGDYAKPVAFELMGKVLEKMKPLHKGDVVKVSFNIKSREYNGRSYTNLNAWNVKVKPKTFQPDEFGIDDSEEVPF